jgi:hypothetical protein
MRKFIAGAALALIVSGAGSTAFAGEVTGSGKGGPNGDGTTPIQTFTAGSICAFSGLDDGSEGGIGGPGQPPQNWGQVAKSFATEGGVGEFAQAGVVHDEGPGTNCHGFASGGGEEG